MNKNMEMGLQSLYERLSKANGVSIAEVRDTMSQKGLTAPQRLELLYNIKNPLKGDLRSGATRDRQTWNLVKSLEKGQHLRNKSLRMTQRWFSGLDNDNQLIILAAFHEGWEIEPELLRELLDLNPTQPIQLPFEDIQARRWDLRRDLA